MKKYIICLILAISCSLVASAQIQREFFGCKLGVCTETELLNKLKAQNIVYKKIEIPQVTSYKVKNSQLMFGGKKWPSISFVFKDGTLAGVDFKATENDLPVDELKARALQLMDKYDAFFDKHSSSQNDILIRMSYWDGKTFLKVDYGINVLTEVLELSAYFASKREWYE